MVTDKQLAQFLNSLSPEQKAALFRDVADSIDADKRKAEKSRFHSADGIVLYVRERLQAEPTPYQEAVLRDIVTYKRVAARSPHGAGKTALAAWFVLWLVDTHDDVKVPTLAPTDRQAGFLWSEIKKWGKRLPSRDFRILTRRLESATKEAFSVSSNDPALIEGVHAAVVGYVFDEAKAIEDPFWDSAEGAFANADNEFDFLGYWFAISTPGDVSGKFYDIHSGKVPDWHRVHIKIEDCIKAGTISRQWVEKRKTEWGEQSAVYRNRVLAEFDESGEDSVIPLSWVEKAIERGHIMEQSRRDAYDLIHAGCDPARYGQDKTAIAILQDKLIRPLSYYSKEDTMQISGRLASRFDKKQKIAIDVIGVGAGVVDRLTELQFNVVGVNVAEAARRPDGKSLTDETDTFEFMNLRSFVWWHMRDRLNPDNPDAIGLPEDERLIGDLTAPRYKFTSTGKIQVESKDDIRKRLKRSTDGADAVALALYAAYDMKEEVIIKVGWYA